MPRCFIVVLLLLPLGSRLLWAQVEQDTTVVLPEIEVEAERIREQRRTAAERLTVLGPADLEATAARSVAAVLDVRTGLVVQRYGSGGLATASLRGVGSGHTLVLLDGLRLVDPQSGQVDLALLPTLLLEGVDIVHGAASGRYGSGALGGAVRLRTLTAEGPARVKAAGSAGAFGERSAGLVAAGGAGCWSGLAAIEARRADGNFPYRDATRVPAREVHRRGADQSLATFFSRAVYRSDKLHLSIAGWHNRAERGLPGPANAPPGAARQWDQHTRLWAESVWWDILSVQASAHQTWLRYHNPATATDDTSRTHAFALEAEIRRIAGVHWLVEGGASFGLDRADLHGGVEEGRLGGFLHATGSYGRWLLYPSLRLDTYHAKAASTVALSPKLGLNVQLVEAVPLHLKASLGRAFRRPTFNERFWQPGGNPGLKAERGWSTEAGVFGQRHREAYSLEAEVTGFATFLRDQIVWRPSLVDVGVQVWRPANHSRVVTHGLEASVRGQGRAGRFAFDGGLTYTLTDARDRSDPAAASFGHRLRYVPPQQLKLYLGLGLGPLRLDGSARLVSPRPITTDGSMLMEPYQVLDAQLRYRLDIGPVAATLALAMENLLDADYAVVRLYPMPPRHARLRLTLDLQP